MFDWNQSPQTVTVSIPLPYKIDAKKVDSVITENYIKLNIPEMKIFKFIDLFDLIDIESSNIIIEDRKIIFYLNKLTEENWPTLEFKTGNKEELKERRKLAEEKFSQKIQLERETADKKRAEFDKFVLDKSIKIDESKRLELREKKSSEKNEAEKELYRFVNEMGSDLANSNKSENMNSEVVDTTMSKMEDSQLNQKKPEGIIPFGGKAEIQIRHPIERYTPNKKENEIFDEKTFEKIQAKDMDKNEKSSMLSEPRQPTSIKVNLTEKLIPHFAARESLSREPPYPKSKTYVPEKNMLGQEIEDRNPLWVKEKADNFFKNKDYRSAINAYNRAIDLDPEFHKCFLNRATSLLLLGEFELALQDLSKLQDLIEKVDSKESEDNFYAKIKIKSMTKSYAIHAILNNYTKALEIIDNILLNKDHFFLLGDKAVEKIEKDRELIESRKQSEDDKISGDKMVEMKNFNTAKEIYTSILEKSNTPKNIHTMNEKILSNLSLIAINEKDHNSAIKYCTDVLKIIKNFKEKITLRNNKYDNSLEIKIILRRAESYVELGEMTKAQTDLETAERFEIRNKAILEKFHFFKEKLKSMVLESYEKSANELLKKKQYSEALGLYEQSIFLIKKKDKVDQVKFFLNRTSCLLALGQFENVSSECSRILGIILKQKNIATINSNLNLLKQLIDLEFNVYVKRAFSLTKSSKIEEAIKDYNSALVINPNDLNVKKNLIALQNIL